MISMLKICCLKKITIKSKGEENIEESAETIKNHYCFSFAKNLNVFWKLVCYKPGLIFVLIPAL